jgi:prolyl-tRNA synthetase
MSMLFSPTLKEAPKEAEVPSHRLLIRGGYIRKLAAGIYSFLPLGNKTLRKIENIVREEMERSGASEVLMPVVQPAELWQESGRWDLYGPELLRVKDRKGGDFVLGPTHEEVITAMVRHEIRSYRDLPRNLFQIQTKYRDEIRPRAGLLRGREFIMKDAYSFDTSEETAHVSYMAMYDAYNRIFERCGLEFRAVEADSGAIGGDLSQEFHVLADTGEDSIVSCPACSYTANVEKAEIRVENTSGDATAVAPPVDVATPGKHSVEEVASFLEVQPSDLLKTLVFNSDQGPLVVVVPGDREANPIKVKNAAGVEWVDMASDEVVKKVTGAPVGFAGPVGLDARVLVDVHIQEGRGHVTGANKGDMHSINVVPGRDFEVRERADLTLAGEGDPCGKCGQAFGFYRGIEVGHIFYLGTKYSIPMGATYLDPDGKEKPMEMGCYGIGVTRTMAAAVEQNHDEYGIIWPVSIAPYELVVLALGNDDELMEKADAYVQELQAQGIEVLFDDRKERPGIKFKDADLTGVPFQLVIGKRGLENGELELKDRKSGEKSALPMDSAVATLTELIRKERALFAPKAL